MSSLTKPTAGALAKPPERTSAINLLPEEWREPVGFFYAFHSDTLRASVGLATRFRFWIKEEGLTLDDAKRVMRTIMRSSASAKHETGPQLMRALAEAIDQVLKARREIEANDQRAADAAKWARERAARTAGIGAL